MSQSDIKQVSNNPVLVTHKTSKLLEIVKKKLDNDEAEDPFKIPELNSLFANCKSDNVIISSVACQAIVRLVEAGQLELFLILPKLIAIIGETSSYLSITSAICDLLKLDLKVGNYDDNYKCPFSIKAPQHPLITVLNQQSTIWRDIIGHMQSIIHQSNEKDLHNYIELLRPVFIYILCNPTKHLPESCKQQTWHLLIRTDKTYDLQLKILQWLPINDTNSCIDTNNRILELCELAVANKNQELCNSLLPLVASVALELLKFNSDPRANILMMENMMQYLNMHAGSIVMFLLAEIMTVTPSVYLSHIIQIGSIILDSGNCTEISAYSFMSSILSWMAYASMLSCDSLNIAKDLVSSITNKSDWTSPDKLTCTNFTHPIHQSNARCQFYSTLCTHINWASDSLPPLLERISKSPQVLKYRHILSGLFLQTNTLEITSKTAKILTQISKSTPDFAPNILSLLLYKLTNARGIEETKEIVYTIPELATTKENMPTIIHILDTLSSGEAPLKYVAIEIYLKLLEIEPRCHHHLMAALIELTSNDSSFLGSVTSAHAMKVICERHPEQGAELVPLLSKILNKRTTSTGSAASALALRGISALCVAGIADVCSTWRVLSPRMNEERRTVVIKSICEFFGDVPSAAAYIEDDYHELLVTCLKKLWTYSCSDNMEIVQASFKALGAFKIQQMRVYYLPESFRCTPRPNATPLAEAEEPADQSTDFDELGYVPGAFWVQMLENIRPQSLKFAGNLLIQFITEELYAYKSGIYMWSMGEPVNYKYLPDKSSARSIGEYMRRYVPNKAKKNSSVVVECLRIYSQKYPKPLPPIKFNLLSNAIGISEETEAYGISLACHQAAVSPSAREYVTERLVSLSNCGKMTSEEFKKCWILCTHLEDICRGVTSAALGGFLEGAVSYIVDRAVVYNDNAIAMFREIMQSFGKALKDDLGSHDNKTVMGNILAKLVEKVDVDHEIFKYVVGAILELPGEQIERMTLPSVWDEVTNDKLAKAVEIRGGLVLKRDNEIPMTWMNEILRVSAWWPSVHGRLFKTLQKILGGLKQEKSNASWTWDLMCSLKQCAVCRIQETIVDSTDKSMNPAEFLCDVLFITIIILASDDCLLTHEDLIATSHDVRAELFPHAMYSISEEPQWKDFIEQIMEWLHLIRFTSLSAEYKSIFHNALTSLKKERYWTQNWTKYLSLKSPLNSSILSKD